MTANPMPLSELLDGLDFPVSKAELIRQAQETGTDTETLHLLQALPVERFDSAAEVVAPLIELA
jgi:hypothetical protein